MTDTPGLKRKRNKDGSFREYWEARADLAKRGYRPSSVRMHYPDTPVGRQQLSSRCCILQAEMLAWAVGGKQAAAGYDGTMAGLSRVFQTNEDSPFRTMKWNSRNNVLKSLIIIERTVGARQVGKLLGPDFKKWHRKWGEPKEADAPPRPWRAKHSMDTARQIISYGLTLGYDDCFRADKILSKIRFSTPPARTSVMTAEHVEMVRKTAHAEGWGSVALATVLQFELAMRQKDIIGEWEPAAHGQGGIRYKQTRWVNGLVEAYDLGATETDVMKSAGHLNRQTSAKYNRGTLEQTNRVAVMRREKRMRNAD